MKGIADTGFLVALVSSQDAHHAWAAEIAEKIDQPLLTCEAVLAETAFHLRNSKVTLEMVETELVKVDFDVNANLAQLVDLAERYSDREPDLADLCLIRMSELNPKRLVITVDRGDFRVYRRNRREMIPLLCPPEG